MAIFSSNKPDANSINPNTLNIINAGTTVIGDLSSDGDMRIDGTVKGYLTSKARLVLGNTSKIEGDIKAVNMEVSGDVNGNIYVSEVLTVKSTAKINGDIISTKLIIESGAEFNGKCSMRDSKNSIKITEKPASQSLEHKSEKAL